VCIKVLGVGPIFVRNVPRAELAIDGAFVFVALAHFEEVRAFLTTLLGSTTDRTATGMFATAAGSGASSPLAERTHEAINGACF
jgi:hypothetical protein